MPPPFLSPWFSVVIMHIIRVSQARSFTVSSPSEFVWVSDTEPSQLLPASQVAGGAEAEEEDHKQKGMKTS